MKAEAEAILAYTTGMIHGNPARALEEKKIKAIYPDIIVALRRNVEIGHTLVQFKDGFRIIGVPVPTNMKSTDRRGGRLGASRCASTSKVCGNSP